MVSILLAMATAGMIFVAFTRVSSRSVTHIFDVMFSKALIIRLEPCNTNALTWLVSNWPAIVGAPDREGIVLDALEETFPVSVRLR